MAVNELNKNIRKYDMKISSSKTKTVGFYGKNIQRVKIEIEGKIIEQGSYFKYLGYLILLLKQLCAVAVKIGL
jgi:hypothetical protein